MARLVGYGEYIFQSSVYSETSRARHCTYEDLPENQCIFVRGFRVARILGMWPRLRGQAGPVPNAGDDLPEPEFDPHLELIGVPGTDSNVRHSLFSLTDL